MKVLSLLLRNGDVSVAADERGTASMKVLSLLLRNPYVPWCPLP